MKLSRQIDIEVNWQEFKQSVDNNEIKSGDKITFSLKNGEEVTIVATYDENENLFFVLEDCLNDTHAMNKSATNKGGWANCEMRKYLNIVVFALLPDELQVLIKPTKIVQILNSKRTESLDMLFLLSNTQVFGDYSKLEPEDSHFDIFKRQKDCVKKCNDNSIWWWLRSPYGLSDGTDFCTVYHNGTGFTNFAGLNGGVVFGFSI